MDAIEAAVKAIIIAIIYVIFALDFVNKTIRLQPFEIMGEKYYVWYAVPVIVTLY